MSAPHRRRKPKPSLPWWPLRAPTRLGPSRSARRCRTCKACWRRWWPARASRLPTPPPAWRPSWQPMVGTSSAGPCCSRHAKVPGLLARTRSCARSSWRLAARARTERPTGCSAAAARQHTGWPMRGGEGGLRPQRRPPHTRERAAGAARPSRPRGACPAGPAREEDPPPFRPGRDWAAKQRETEVSFRRGRTGGSPPRSGRLCSEGR
mmetsp:Transcript_55388/g.161690  ORF Transcript_55388/g.161690 Transcript_55388/m.161690 type:complete len:208 (-) Transcript_55388:73-696(-)